MEETRPRGGRRVPDPPGRAETRRATSPYGARRPPSSGRVGESGCLRVQPESGDRSHPRLNTGGTPIANKYGDGKVKRTSKGGLKALEIVKGEADWTEETPPPLGRGSDPRKTRGGLALRATEGSSPGAFGDGAAGAGPGSRRTGGRCRGAQVPGRALQGRGPGPRSKGSATRGAAQDPLPAALSPHAGAEAVGGCDAYPLDPGGAGETVLSDPSRNTDQGV